MGQNLKIFFIFSHLKKLLLYVVLSVYNFRRKEIFNAFIKISLSQSTGPSQGLKIREGS